ncbi:MAG TPA: erythromycin esterase family protein, partial [Flavitalea sp.]|nr:erythromycin esterase family protein [Flavitalea sp.]
AVYDNSVGGMGGFLLKLYPENYFVVGTGTAEGTYAGTREPKPTNNNKMEVFKLESPIKDSWEQLFKSNAADKFYVLTKSLTEEIKPTRFVGYGSESGKSSYDKSNLASLYDGYIFVRTTHAGEQLK